MEPLKKALEDLQRDWTEFKQTNDARLKLIESKGSAPADYEEKLGKINGSLDTLSKSIEVIQARQNAPTAGDVKAQSDEVAKKGKLALAHYMKKGNLSPAQESEIKAAYEQHEERKFLAVESDPDGGYFVTHERDSEIRKKIFESSPIRQLAEVQSISSDALEVLYDDDEVSGEWVGETQERAETDTSRVSMLKVFVHELSAQPKATQKLLDDAAIDIEAWLAGKVQDKFARMEATAFVSGDGVSKPKGILSYANGDGSFNTIEQVNSGSSGAPTSDGLILLQNKLLEEYQSNATWLMKRVTAGAVRLLKDAEDRYLWSVSGDLTTGVMQSLLGRPVRFADDMPVAAPNSLSIAYGDFRAGYLVVDRIGIRVLRDPYTSKPFVKFYTTKGVGGGVQRFQAIKLQKFAV